MAPTGALGGGATYDVVQCSAQNRGDEARLRQPRAYHLERRCADASGAHALRIGSVFRAQTGARGQLSWKAPPQTGFVLVRVDAKLRRHAGHRARLLMADAEGRTTHSIASGGTEPTPFDRFRWQGPRQGRFIARLICQRSGGCEQSDRAKTWIRDVRLRLVDEADPVVTPSGSLLGSGWMRGTHAVSANLSDTGSGLARASVRVNGLALDEHDPSCDRAPDGNAAIRLVPCERNQLLVPLTPNTAEPPFRDGLNALAICAEDFAGNETCDTRTIRIDNAPPEIGFADAQVPEDPELIRAPVTDPHSGVSSGKIFVRASGAELWQPLDTQLVGGELRARVDSAGYPEGPYEFKAEATDVAGNDAETVLRQDGLPMILTFPLRAGVTLNARIEPGGQRRVLLAYGKARRAVGRLRNRDGTPLAEREVRVEEYFGTGALIDRRIRTVVTDEQGRWRSRLPPGPSRKVYAYFDGDARYLDQETRAGALAVRSRARFRTSRARVPEGKRVTFKGRIARRGARIPNGGKLLELQVRERPGRWSTVREAFRTRPAGRYRLRYRFGRFYQRNVRFRFRVKVAREGDWPYGPASSPGRTVTVLAR